jgi:hypothetical protein
MWRSEAAAEATGRKFGEVGAAGERVGEPAPPPRAVDRRRGRWHRPTALPVPPHTLSSSTHDGKGPALRHTARHAPLRAHRRPRAARGGDGAPARADDPRGAVRALPPRAAPLCVPTPRCAAPRRPPPAAASPAPAARSEEAELSVEDVLGRDAASVFPTRARAALLESDAVKALVGDRKFIKESEVAEIRAAAAGGGGAAAAGAGPSRPLAEVLYEAREAKNAAFQDRWKTMKEGKNRPLDPDEADFLDAVAEGEAAARRRAAEEERAELAEFADALRRRQEAAAAAEAAAAERGAAAPAAAAPAAAPAAPAAPAAAPPKRAKPAVVVRRKPAAAAAAPPAEEPDAKRLRGGDAGGDVDSDGGGGGLAGLLGAYGSDSD